MFTVTGGDWDELLAETAVRERRTHHHQHGSAAPVDARRAPADPRARGRDRRAGPVGDRLPAHRHREVLRVPHLDPGRHLRHPRRLPVAGVQRGRLLHGRREAAGHRGSRPRPGDPGAADGADPDLLAPGGAGHRRHGTRRADRDDRRLPGARGSPAPDGVPHRAADEHGVHPAGRGGPGTAGRLDRPDQPVHQGHGIPAAGVRQTADRATDLEGPDGRRRHPAARGLHAAGRHRPDPAVRRAALGPAQGDAVQRVRGLRLRGPDLHRRRLLRPVPAPAGRDARVAQDHEAGRQAARGARPGDGRRTRKSAGRRNCRSAPTGWATRWSTSARSWASRWSR